MLHRTQHDSSAYRIQLNSHSRSLSGARQEFDENGEIEWVSDEYLTFSLKLSNGFFYTICYYYYDYCIYVLLVRSIDSGLGLFVSKCSRQHTEGKKTHRSTKRWSKIAPFPNLWQILLAILSRLPVSNHRNFQCILCYCYILWTKLCNVPNLETIIFSSFHFRYAFWNIICIFFCR